MGGLLHVDRLAAIEYGRTGPVFDPQLNDNELCRISGFPRRALYGPRYDSVGGIRQRLGKPPQGGKYPERFYRRAYSSRFQVASCIWHDEWGSKSLTGLFRGQQVDSFR